MAKYTRGWSEEDKDYLLRNRNKYPVEDIAQIIGKSVSSIYQMLQKMGLDKSKEKSKESEKYRAKDGFKLCKSCEEKLPVSEYYKDSNTVDHYCSMCKRCKNKSEKEAKLKKKSEAIKKLKEETENKMITCRVCGKTKLGKEFKFDSHHKRRLTECRECELKRNKKSYTKRIKEGTDW